MAPKGKKVTMSLNDFLKTDQGKFSFLKFRSFNILVKEIGDESWADEGFSLPTARKGNFLVSPC